MKLSEFDYHLPEESIAQTPLEKRDESKLMILNKKEKTREHKIFKNILEKLWENDVLVINKTRVINARLSAFNEKCDHIEIFLHKELWQGTWECIVFPWKKLKVWTKVYFKDENWEKLDLEAEIIEIADIWRIVKFNKSWIEFMELIEKIGNIPLPPYIKEKLENSERYQTVFNEIPWSVAAPTAWLHFTDEILEKLEKAWVKIEKVLLHVWAWTFKSVQTEDIKDHQMHSEYIELEEETAKRLNSYKKEWKRIIAVWTTSIRVLESFSDESWELKSWKKETSIFIYPWYNWKFVDAIITNFHLPKSTLIMLVSSFAWKDFTLESYKEAVEKKYRFFSFWDAMFIE